jgi:hypothetical protein
MHAYLRCDDVIAGIAFAAVVEAVHAQPDQSKPMDDADSAVVGDAAQPVEAEKLGGGLLGIRHG